MDETRLPPKVINALKILVHQLVVGEFELLLDDGKIGRLTIEELKRAITEYGRVLVDIPQEAFEVATTYELSGNRSRLLIELPLWTLEEGRSDLTLSVTVDTKMETPRIEIQDLHVL